MSGQNLLTCIWTTLIAKPNGGKLINIPIPIKSVVLLIFSANFTRKNISNISPEYAYFYILNLSRIVYRSCSKFGPLAIAVFKDLPNLSFADASKTTLIFMVALDLSITQNQFR
jgi:hypothetical protein